MPDLIVYAFILYMHNNNDQSLILVVPGTIYYGFMRRVDSYSRDDKNVYTICTYTRLIIYYGKAVKILVEHFIFYYTDRSSI